MLGNKVLVQLVTTTPMDQHLALLKAQAVSEVELAIPALSIVHKHPLQLLFPLEMEMGCPKMLP